VLGEALDALSSSLTSVAVLAERTVMQLCDPHHNGGLPAFLIHHAATPGLHSGLMMVQYTAASLVAELRMRSVPASVQSIPTGANTEDHVSMSALAARHAAWCLATTETVVAIALLASAQAVDLSGVPMESPLMAAAHARIRAHVPVQVEDRVIARDIAKVVGLLRSGQLG
jgi:histidine ammonia-lyase